MNQIVRFNISIVLVALLLPGWAKDQIEKKKVIQESYEVSTTTLLRIDNKFGKIEINDWEKNEFSVKVEMIARGRNEDRAQRILDQLYVDIDEGSTEISFETSANKMKSKNEESFEINYTIYMPTANPLDVENSFGDVYMGDRAGDLDLDVSYGSMKVGDVAGEANIELSFGSGSINNITEGEITIKYSKFDIESARKLDLTQGFSDVELDEVGELELESKYGGVEIEKADRVDAEVSFSSFEIEELTGELELEASYIGDFKIGRLAKTFTLVDIEGKFGSYEIAIEEGLNANIDAEFSYADLRLDSDVDASFHYRVKESNKSYYKGKIGNGDDSKMIRIESGYGNARIKVD